MNLTRRSFLLGSAGAAVAIALPTIGHGGESANSTRRAALLGSTGVAVVGMPYKPLHHDYVRRFTWYEDDRPVKRIFADIS